MPGNYSVPLLLPSLHLFLSIVVVETSAAVAAANAGSVSAAVAHDAASAEAAHNVSTPLSPHLSPLFFGTVAAAAD